MREIKFRAWDKKNNEMLSHNTLFNLDCSNEYPFLGLLDGHYNHFLDKYHVEITQYTGLKDKGGKEIYEDDIVKVNDFMEHIGIIKFGKHKSNDMSNSYECGNLGFYIEFNDEYHLLRQDIYFWSGLGIEVMGNIYENLELLK